MENPVLLIGAKGLALTAFEIFESNQVLIYGYLDDDATLQGKEIHGVLVLGSTEDSSYLKLIGGKTNVFITYESNKLRKNITQFILEEKKLMPVNAVHSRAYVSAFASIGHGNLIASGAYVGAGAEVGSHNQILANAVVESGAKLADYIHIGAGSIINSDVIIDEGVFIGSGSTIISGVTIGKNARIGAGSVVMAPVKAGQTVFGVPAVDVKN